MSASSPCRVIGADIYIVHVDGRHPVVVELHTDAGISGLGEAALAYGLGATAAAGMIKDLVEALVLGADAFAIEALYSRMYDHTFWAKGGGPIVFGGISAIEQALWDIKGKALRVPAYELLGGRCRDSVRMYANGWSFRAHSPDEFARAAEKVVRDGYDALKMYPLANPVTGDNAHGQIRHVEQRAITREAERLAIARVRAVREAIGPDVDLMVDMSGELTPDGIVRIARELAPLDIFFLEEPVDAFDPEGIARVRQSVTMPIAAGERVYTRYGFRRLLELRAVDIVQPDVGNAGGLMEVKKIATMAEAFDTRIQPHVCAGPVLTAATLQLDATLTNLLIQEVYPYRAPEHFGIVDEAPERTIRNGVAPIPDRPGLGVELVHDAVRPFLWATCGRTNRA
ncbi:MAG TPA: mandelate racemase/muconate lactonizing enzyme family protein [Casimicrobiaceae bacterium]|nr:mandelate racemase/muconate lactonizing enzyme family protein [Casimicrobiaceae bacterium]